MPGDNAKPQERAEAEERPQSEGSKQGFSTVLEKFYGNVQDKLLETLNSFIRREVNAAYILAAPPETYVELGNEGNVELVSEPVFAPITVTVKVEDSKTVVTNLVELLNDYVMTIEKYLGKEMIGKKFDIGIDPLGIGTALLRYTVDTSLGIVSKFDELKVDEAVTELARFVISKAGRKARKDPMEYAKFLKWLKMRKLLTRKFPKSLRGLDELSVEVLFTFALIGNSLVALRNIEPVESLNVKIYPVTPSAKLVWEGDRIKVEATRFTGYTVVEVTRYEKVEASKSIVKDVIRRVLESVRSIMPHGIDTLLRLYMPISLSPNKVAVEFAENTPLPREGIEAYMIARTVLLSSVAPPPVMVEVLKAVKSELPSLERNELICEAYIRVMEYAFSVKRFFTRRFVKRFAEAVANESRKIGGRCLMVRFNAVAPKILEYITSAASK